MNRTIMLNTFSNYPQKYSYFSIGLNGAPLMKMIVDDLFAGPIIILLDGCLDVY